MAGRQCLRVGESEFRLFDTPEAHREAALQFQVRVKSVSDSISGSIRCGRHVESGLRARPRNFVAGGTVCRFVFVQNTH